MNLLRENVLYLMRRGEDNPNSLAEKSGARQPNIFRILEGEVEEPRLNTIQPLANYWGVSVEDLKYKNLSKKNEVELKEPITRLSGSRGSAIEIPQYRDAGGGMGGGVVLRDQPGEIHTMNVTSEWISKNIKSHTGIANLCIVTGFGNSMQPLYNPGDPLIVDRGVKTVDVDATYFFRVGNEGFIKLLQRIPGEGIRVISKNKDFETWTIKEGMDFEVFGQVLKAWCGTDV